MKIFSFRCLDTVGSANRKDMWPVKTPVPFLTSGGWRRKPRLEPAKPGWPGNQPNEGILCWAANDHSIRQQHTFNAHSAYSDFNDLFANNTIYTVTRALLFLHGSCLRRSQPTTKSAILITTSFAAEAGLCRQSPYLRPVPAATTQAILIMTSLATELTTPSVTDVRTPYRV